MDALERGSLRNVQVFVFMQDGCYFLCCKGRISGSLPPEAGAGPLMVRHPRTCVPGWWGPWAEVDLGMENRGFGLS